MKQVNDVQIREMIMSILAEHPEGLTNKEIQEEILLKYDVYVPLYDGNTDS